MKKVLTVLAIVGTMTFAMSLESRVVLAGWDDELPPADEGIQLPIGGGQEIEGQTGTDGDPDDIGGGFRSTPRPTPPGRIGGGMSSCPCGAILDLAFYTEQFWLVFLR